MKPKLKGKRGIRIQTRIIICAKLSESKEKSLRKRFMVYIPNFILPQRKNIVNLYILYLITIISFQNTIFVIYLRKLKFGETK